LFKLREKPVAFIPNENNNELQEILLEEHEDFDIFWYHWPFDGPALLGPVLEEDYEPVIIVYDDDGRICQVIIRRAWNYRNFDLEEYGLILPPTILFEKYYHHPLVKTNANQDEFELKRQGFPETDLDVTKISSDAISDKFRTGKRHRTNYKLKECDDPAHIGEIASNEC